MHIKKGQTVVILAGKDKGKSGEVTRAFPKMGTVLVAGRNMVKRHEKPRRQGEKGQIVDREMPIHASNVRLADAAAKPKAKAKTPKK